MSGLERARGKALAEAGVRKVDVRASATAPASPPQAGAVRLLQCVERNALLLLLLLPVCCRRYWPPSYHYYYHYYYC